MKKLKKLASVALALVMAMALMVPAFAAGDVTITVANPEAGKEYTAYKIFDYNHAGENYAYSFAKDSAWKDTLVDVDAAGKVTNVKVTGLEIQLAADGSKYIVNKTDDFSAPEFAAALKTALDGMTTKPAGTTVTAGEADAETGVVAPVELSVPGLGYYFVANTNGALCNLTNTNENVTIYDKNDKPTIEKTVNDTDRLVGVGQELTYTITGEVPSTEGYETYIYKVTDTMSAGLTFNKNVKVEITGKTLADEVVEGWIAYPDGVNGFELTIPVKNYQDVIGNEIKVTYTATVNNAAITATENPNKAELTYSNNPADETSTDKTPEVIVKVYTAKIVVDKYVGNKDNTTDTATKLNGATFILQNADGEYYYRDAAAADSTKAVTWVTDKNAATAVTTDEVNGVNGYAEFLGLGNGTYKLIETAAPAGYNLLTDPVEVNVQVDKDNPNAVAVANVSIEKEVANYTGAVLPSTGGMGTTIFYALGGVLLVGSAVLFVTKKRLGE